MEGHSVISPPLLKFLLSCTVSWSGNNGVYFFLFFSEIIKWIASRGKSRVRNFWSFSDCSTVLFGILLDHNIMQLEKRLKIIMWLRKRLAIDYKNDLSLKQFYIHDYRLNTNTSFKYNINLSRSLLHFHSTFYFPHLTFRG